MPQGTLDYEYGHKDLQRLNFGLQLGVAMVTANQQKQGAGTVFLRTSSVTQLIYNSLSRALEASSAYHVRTRIPNT